MIALKKLPEPSVLSENKAQWTAQYKEAKKEAEATGGRISDAIKARYQDSEIKKQIIAETNGKCAYCESKILHTSPGDIEHIKPKSQFEDDIFEWNNLTLSCSECNRRKSDNYDPELVLINPYETDPESHLVACGSRIVGFDDIGDMAVELLELNRVHLLEKRSDRLANLNAKWNEVKGAPNPTLKKLRLKQLVRIMESREEEYVMVSRAFVKPLLDWLKKSERTAQVAVPKKSRRGRLPLPDGRVSKNVEELSGDGATNIVADHASS